MKYFTVITCKLLALLLLLAAPAVSQDFDFFYFVQQWPGSYCDTSNSCCYPTTGKPEADFGIHGLWPNYNNGSYPSKCDPDNPFDQEKISSLLSRMETEWPTLSCPSNNGTKFWKHEWEKHGTCSEFILDQHCYFETALDLKYQVNLLHVLNSAGIEPNGQSFSLESIKNAIKEAIGYTPYVQCNKDFLGNQQLYQIFLCIDKYTTDLIECPIFPKETCNSDFLIEFPGF